MKSVQANIFDFENLMDKLTRLNDPLVRLNQVIDWEKFRVILEKNIIRQNNLKKGGCPSFDLVMMFKILILQRLNNLSDNQTEFLIADRRSFMRFFD